MLKLIIIFKVAFMHLKNFSANFIRKLSDNILKKFLTAI